MEKKPLPSNSCTVNTVAAIRVAATRTTASALVALLITAACLHLQHDNPGVHMIWSLSIQPQTPAPSVGCCTCRGRACRVRHTPPIPYLQVQLECRQTTATGAGASSTGAACVDGLVCRAWMYARCTKYNRTPFRVCAVMTPSYAMSGK